VTLVKASYHEVAPIVGTGPCEVVVIGPVIVGPLLVGVVVIVGPVEVGGRIVVPIVGWGIGPVLPLSGGAFVSCSRYQV
jgi:hypothetical protein